MKPFTSKPVLILCSRSLSRALSTNSIFDSRSVRVSVWWDFENCHLPQGANVFKVAHSITSAVRGSGIKGPVQITAFGDVAQLSRTNQEAMSSTGITLTHVPNGGKNSADRSLLVDLMYWVSQNPPPAHLFLISGDRDFATVLHRLRMSNYNILLAGPESAPGVLCSAASIVWQWNALVKEENITGKYFNQPPDGPYGSWYGHYKVPLENPFEVSEQSASLRPLVIEQSPSRRPEEVLEFNQDQKLRPIPKTVMNKIRHILTSHPKGITITDLRSELGRCNVDVDLYGYKKFSRFLLSMPHILKLQSGRDGQYFVHSVHPKLPESSEPTQGAPTGPVATKKDPESVFDQVVSAKGATTKPSPPNSIKHNVKPYEDIKKPSSTCTIEINVKPNEKIEKVSSPTSCLPPISDKRVKVKPDENIKKPSSTSTVEMHTKPIETSEKPMSPSVIRLNDKHDEKIEKDNEAGMKEQCSHSVEIDNSTPEVGFLGRTWRQWLYGMDGFSGPETSTAERTGSNIKVAESNLSSSSQRKDAVEQSSNFSSKNDKSPVEKLSGFDVADSSKASGDVGVIKRMITRCMFWRETPAIENSRAQSVENLEAERVKDEIFSQESFWKGLEAFLCTPCGSVLILHSMSREQMAQNLQKHGPSVLSHLTQSDLLHLVDLLISEKKWVEESLSQAYPFKLVQPPKYSSSSIVSTNKTTSRSVSSDTSSPSAADSFPQDQHISPTGVSPSTTDKKARGSNKSRNDILSDCQKLVDDIVKESPGGFNMGCFRRRFVTTYGYTLDIQKLGYQKLVTLMQIMPGVKVEAPYIYPSCNVPYEPEISPSVEINNLNRVSSKSDSELSDPPNQDDEPDTTWDELGPVAETGSKQKEEAGDKKSATGANAKRVNRDYEALENDYMSDSEDDISVVKGSELPGKRRADKEDSALLRILDSFYSTKENKKEGLQNEENIVDPSENESRRSSNSYVGGNLGLKTESPFARSVLKAKSTGRYSFISEQNEDNKEKAVDGILGSLKKSVESRVHG